MNEATRINLLMTGFLLVVILFILLIFSALNGVLTAPPPVDGGMQVDTYDCSRCNGSDGGV